MTEDTWERGPLRSYEVTWRSGHVEIVEAHQVTWDSTGIAFTGTPVKHPKIKFMGEIDGSWSLVLAADESDVATVRDVTSAERLT